MSNINNLTKTEVLKLINDTKKEHESTKKKIDDNLIIVSEYENKLSVLSNEINDLLNELSLLEKIYSDLIDKYNEFK